MEYVYSRVEPGTLLHIINRKDEIGPTRTDLCPVDEFLQVSCFELEGGKTFRPHKHVRKESVHTITQESWVVLSGCVRATLYDIDDSIIAEPILEAGDCSITFYGGHNYKALRDGTKVLEFKTGPYQGQLADKRFID